MRHLTDKKIENIENLDLNILVEILHICEDRLVLIHIDEENCRKVYGKSKRWVYNKIKQGNLKTIPLAGRNFLAVNL